MAELGNVCVFCGSKPGTSPAFLDAARELGAELARRGIGLVYGGASVGLMGALADAALEGGGKVTGVIPQRLVDREIAHTGLTDLRVVGSMHERKATMEKLSDGFIALPGGFGTFEELFEIITWRQLGLHQKPIAVLNAGGYYDPLLHVVRRGVDEGFISIDHADGLIFDRDAGSLVERMLLFQPAPAGEKVITRRQT